MFAQRPSRPPIVVIGAGLGGLAAAALLTRAGDRVIVLERHTEPGGFAVTFERAGFTFDASLHHLDAVGPGQANRPLLDALGISDALDLYRDPFLRRDLVPGADLLLPQNGDALYDLLATRFPGDAAGLRELFRAAAEAHAAVYAGAPLRVVGTAADRLNEWLRSPVLIEVVGGITGYVGRSPRTCPAGTFLMLFHAYHVLGGWRLRGGSRALTTALVDRIEAGGGEVRVAAAVTGIRVGGRGVEGVEVDGGEVIATSDVIAGLPLPRLAELLATAEGVDAWRTRIAGLPLSGSFYRLFVGLDGDHTAGQAYETRVVDANGQCSVTIPSVGDDAWAGPGRTVACAVAAAPSGDDDGDFRQAAKARLMGVLTGLLPGAERCVAVSTLAHPGTWAYYTGSPGGAAMGMGAGAPMPARTPIPGLTLAGAWVAPGPGQTAVMHSGARAARLVRAR